MSGCVACGGPLTGRQRKFCSARCRKASGRAAWVTKVYGITLADWDAIFDHQGGVCAICEREPRPGETFVLDHEHRTGRSGPIRGIVCANCNLRVIGKLKGAKARNLARYLTHPPALAALGREVVAPGRPKRKRQPRRRARA